MNWHYLENGETRGPVTQEEFVNLVKQGTITPDTNLWCEGMADWKKYGDLIAGRKPAAAAPVESAPPAAAPAPASLHIQHEHVAGERQGTCSRCGTVVAVSQLYHVGASSLCPTCQVGQRRMAFGSDAPMEYAGIGSRLLAKILDTVILVVGLVIGVGICMLPTLLALWMTAKNNSKTAAGFVVIFYAIGSIFTLVFPIYYLIIYPGKHAATMGKRICRIHIIRTNGQKFGYWWATVRAFAEGMSIQLIVGLVFYVVALFDSQRRTLADHLCGTRVVKN